MRAMAFRLSPLTLPIFALTLGVATSAHADVYSYVDWEEADPSAGTASGTITLSDDSTVTVTFEAINPDGSAGTLYGAQVDGGTNYWEPDAPYISDEVENAPPLPDLLQLSGGDDQVYMVGLSEPIKDPVMALVSLGAPGNPITYDFDSPFTIVSQGAGYWGGSDTALEQQDGDVLWGEEGHGTIRFLGTFDSFSWTAPSPESWHGFTFAIRTTERLEPTLPDAGADDAGSDAGSAADAGAPTEAGADPDADGGSGGDAAADDETEDDSTDDDTSDDAADDEDAGGADDEDAGAVDDDADEDDDSDDDTDEDDTAEAGADDEDDTDDDVDSGGSTVSCSCKVVGAPSHAPVGGALLALGLGAACLLRRRRN